LSYVGPAAAIIPDMASRHKPRCFSPVAALSLSKSTGFVNGWTRFWTRAREVEMPTWEETLSIPCVGPFAAGPVLWAGQTARRRFYDICLRPRARKPLTNPGLLSTMRRNLNNRAGQRRRRGRVGIETAFQRAGGRWKPGTHADVEWASEPQDEQAFGPQ